MRHMPKSALLPACLVLTVLMGCDAGRTPVYPVEGRVMISDGTPLRGGIILFEAPDAQQTNARGYIGDDGAYRMTTFEPNDGAMAGKHKVMFSPAVSGANPRKKYEDTIHEQYLDFDTSGFTVDVSPDAKPNRFDFTLDPPEPE